MTDKKKSETKKILKKKQTKKDGDLFKNKDIPTISTKGETNKDMPTHYMVQRDDTY
jgi:desulfoferrodoxin (superoxide reductase-like protein)